MPPIWIQIQFIPDLLCQCNNLGSLLAPIPRLDENGIMSSPESGRFLNSQDISTVMHKFRYFRLQIINLQMLGNNDGMVVPKYIFADFRQQPESAASK